MRVALWVEFPCHSACFPTLPAFPTVYKQLGQLHLLRQDEQVCALVKSLEAAGAKLCTPAEALERIRT